MFQESVGPWAGGLTCMLTGTVQASMTIEAWL
jgi:hypothetical protein